jgi:hypothetical protein
MEEISPSSFLVPGVKSEKIKGHGSCDHCGK